MFCVTAAARGIRVTGRYLWLPLASYSSLRELFWPGRTRPIHFDPLGPVTALSGRLGPRRPAGAAGGPASRPGCQWVMRGEMIVGDQRPSDSGLSVMIVD